MPLSPPIPQVGAPFKSVPYAATLQLVQKTNNRVALVGNMTIAPPSGNSDGALVYLWLTANGGGPYNVTLDPAIIVPSTSSFTSPQAVGANVKVCFVFQYDAIRNGGQWELHQFIMGY
jgi:hypothetical protein